MSMLLFCECKLIKTLKLFQNFKWLAKAIQDNSFAVYCKIYGTHHVQTPKVKQVVNSVSADQFKRRFIYREVLPTSPE